MTKPYDAERLKGLIETARRKCANAPYLPIKIGEVECIATALAAQAEEIERLRGALKVADNLVAVIVQSPVNVWYVDAVDPETTVCDAEHAIRTALVATFKEPQP